MWLSDGSETSRRKYADTRRAARHAVRAAKDAWFQQKALEAGRGRNGGKWCGETSGASKDGGEG